MTAPSTRYLRRSAAARYVRDTWGLPCSPKWLAKLAVIGGGPIYRKAGRFPLYTPDELDKLIEWVNASSPVGAAQLEGEHLFAVERLVVSPSAGLFSPNSSVTVGTSIDVGRIIGSVGDTEVRSPFAGVIQNFIAVEGERVTTHQPIAWLRSN